MSRKSSAAPVVPCLPGSASNASRRGRSWSSMMLSPVRSPGRNAVWWGPNAGPRATLKRTDRTLARMRYSVLSSVIGR
eukprot:351168-Chlamydomonas_euryale.AAC.5